MDVCGEIFHCCAKWPERSSNLTAIFGPKFLVATNSALVKLRPPGPQCRPHVQIVSSYLSARPGGARTLQTAPSNWLGQQPQLGQTRLQAARQGGHRGLSSWSSCRDRLEFCRHQTVVGRTHSGCATHSAILICPQMSGLFELSASQKQIHAKMF